MPKSGEQAGRLAVEEADIQSAPDSSSNDGLIAGPFTGDQALDNFALPRIIVIGCSGHARVVVDILEEEKRCRIVGLVDTYKPSGTEVLGYQVLGSDEDLPALVAAGICNGVIVAIGDNWVRSRVVEKIRERVPQIRFVSAIHPAARIARNVSIGAGTVVMAGTIVNTHARIGEFCILNTGCSLDHDSVMKHFSSLAPRAVTGGGVKIGAFSAIAIGATISHEVQIGDHTIVGAGATVLKDLPDQVVAYGTPARVIRERSPGDPYLGEQSNKRTSRHAQGPAFVRSLKSLKLIPAGNDQWNLYLSRTPHDFFHTAPYHEIETHKSGEPWLAVYGTSDKFLAWPYILQEIGELEDGTATGKLRDVTSVYGYAGPIMFGCADDHDFIAAAWSAVVDTWRSESVISVFTRFHPVLANHRWLAEYGGRTEIPGLSGGPCSQGKTVAINLSASQDEIACAYKRQLRQALRRLMGMGMLTTPDPEWVHLDSFVRLYYSTMKRNKATGFYFFPGQYFRKLKEALGPYGSLMVTHYSGEIIAAGLLIEYQGIVNVHLLATDDRFVALSPGKLVIHAAQSWAQARGNRFLHLGGGRGSRDDDPLFRFKAQFSATHLPFYTGRWILDAAACEFLCARRRKQAELQGQWQLAPAFFPSYRAPFINPGSTEVTALSSPQP
ncbi:MAG: NeuD/PglB/VioB family sugar acetyltransferase [Acidobacteriaceae bacterium]|nr:NeuD/PglB/VioB family sugar acetyltransferase [Acidobacteriaceae bacterium]MBV9782137.1 NeuD/PglB/VioB family sugar acetyltransferase [Acidobacteriaceae bacterium]